MEDLRKRKIITCLYSLIYIVLTVVIIVSSVSIFNNCYYELFYVSGSSMNPTLSGDSSDADYGLTDNSLGAKKALKRYQLVTTHYFEHDSSLKIKRILFLPGESFKVENNEFYLYDVRTRTFGNKLEKNFEPATGIGGYTKNFPVYNPEDPDSKPYYTLGPNEYFVAGDNWSTPYSSLDCFSLGKGIDISLLVGVVTKIEGKCVVEDGKVVKRIPGVPRYFLGVDY